MGVLWNFGSGYACKISGGLDSKLYLEILRDEMARSVDICVPDPAHYMFQQDNDPTHKAKIISKYFAEEKIETLDWPPNSPDLNPIENLWAIVKKNIVKRGTFTSKDKLWEAFEEEWEKVDVELCQKLVRSMPNRILRCLEARGSPIKY